MSKNLKFKLNPKIKNPKSTWLEEKSTHLPEIANAPPNKIKVVKFCIVKTVKLSKPNMQSLKVEKTNGKLFLWLKALIESESELNLTLC